MAFQVSIHLECLTRTHIPAQFLEPPAPQRAAPIPGSGLRAWEAGRQACNPGVLETVSTGPRGRRTQSHSLTRGDTPRDTPAAPLGGPLSKGGFGDQAVLSDGSPHTTRE